MMLHALFMIVLSLILAASMLHTYQLSQINARLETLEQSKLSNILYTPEAAMLMRDDERYAVSVGRAP